jgi:hypothetical protein
MDCRRDFDCVRAGSVALPNLNTLTTHEAGQLSVPPIGQPALLPSEIITDPGL